MWRGGQNSRKLFERRGGIRQVNQESVQSGEYSGKLRYKDNRMCRTNGGSGSGKWGGKDDRSSKRLGTGKRVAFVETQGTRKIGEGDVKPLSASSCTHRKLKSGERKSSMSHSMWSA